MSENKIQTTEIKEHDTLFFKIVPLYNKEGNFLNIFSSWFFTIRN